MIDLQEATKELESAKAHYDEMLKFTTIRDYERSWKALLGCLEKFWQKVEYAGKKVPQFNKYQNNYRHERKNDPLLKYLKQARNADNHTVNEIIATAGGHIGIGFQDPKGGYIENLEVVNGVIKNYKGDPLKATYTPPKIIAKEAINRGVTTSIPDKHLGQTIQDPENPSVLAMLGIRYYENYLNSIQRELGG